MAPGAQLRARLLTLQAQWTAQKQARKAQGPLRTSFKKYGLTHEVYQRLLTRQHGQCALCHSIPLKKRLLIDHDHRTGHVRQLLCHACNTGLGMFKDDPAILQRAIDYLLWHKQ